MELTFGFKKIEAKATSCKAYRGREGTGALRCGESWDILKEHADFRQGASMTTPYERTRALRQAGELLERLAQREDVPADVRKQAQGVLRHYPEHWALEAMAQNWQTFTGDKTFGLAPESEGRRG